MDAPRTRYAESTDGTFIAYQVFGQGPDLLVAWPWISHVELLWEVDEPSAMGLHRCAPPPAGFAEQAPRARRCLSAGDPAASTEGGPADLLHPEQQRQDDRFDGQHRAYWR